MILFTTSRKPSRRTRRFCRELSSVIPHSLCVNRGKASVRKVADRAVADGFSRVIFILETKGNPSALRVMDVSPARWDWMGQMYISSVSLLLDRKARISKPDAEGLCVDADKFGSVLSRVFEPLECEDDAVILIERGGKIHFEYEGESVGPEFEVTGWSAVPRVLEQ